MTSRVAVRFALIVLSCATALPALGQYPNAARDLASACFTCHGTEGNSVQGVPPSLAGRNAGELFQMMKDFQTGKRPATLMHQQARGYTDQELKLITGYFASMRPTAPRLPAKP